MRSALTETEKYAEFVAAAGISDLQDAMTTQDLEEPRKTVAFRIIDSDVFASKHASISEPQTKFLLIKTSESLAWTPMEYGNRQEASDASRAVVESPFEALYQGKPDSEKFSMLVQTLRGLARLAFANELADRVVTLNETVEEEEPGFTVSVDSLRWMIAFFRENPRLRKPRIFLTNVGNFRAVWQASPNRRFAIEFIPDGTVWFVAFTPDIDSPDGVDRLSGSATVSKIMGYASSASATRWMCS